MMVIYERKVIRYTKSNKPVYEWFALIGNCKLATGCTSLKKAKERVSQLDDWQLSFLNL